MIYLVIKHLVGKLVDGLIPEPKPGNIFGFLVEIARNVLKISLTLIITALLVAPSGAISPVVEMVIKKFIEFFIKEIFNIVLSLVIVSLSVPYSGEGS